MINAGFLTKPFYFALFILSGSILLIISAGISYGQEVRYMGSLQYSTGSYYFTERTGSFYFNNGLGISGDKISFSISVPFIAQSTPWVSNVGTGILPTGGPKNGMISNSANGSKRRGNRKVDLGTADTLSYTQTNFGDPSLSASTELFSTENRTTAISAHAGVKIPLANPKKGFGTGKWDLGGGLSWSQRITAQTLFLANGMFWKLGDMDDLDFNNIITYSAALGQSFHDGKWMGIVSFSGITEIINEIDPPLTVGTGLTLQASNKMSLNSNLSFGLTESASDFSVGLGWSIKL